MFVRFSTNQVDTDTGQPVGVFTVAYRLLDGHEMQQYEAAEVRSILDWFKAQLPIPDRFSRSKNNCVDGVAVCWFKPNAVQCISNARYLAQLISQYDVVTTELTTVRPGYIVYSDQFQVVAEPYSDTFN